MQHVKCLAARALRGIANRLDPEPPHMEAALRLLGWGYDGQHWTYYAAGCVPTTTQTGNATSGVVTYYWPDKS